VERIKAIVFDWDGTVVNTMQIKICNASNIFSEQYDVDSESIAESYRKYSGIPRRDLFDLIARENIGRGLSKFEFNRLSSEFTSRNVESYKTNKVFDNNKRKVLVRIKEHGFMMFVSSSANKDEIEKLAMLLDLEKYFKEMLGSTGDFRKGIAHINYIKKKYGIKATQIMFVGDERADMRLAGRLGVMCVGVVNNKEKNELKDEFGDYVIQELSSIVELLQRV